MCGAFDKYHGISFRVFSLCLYKRLDSYSCHWEASAGDSKCRFLNALPLVQFLSWIEESEGQEIQVPFKVKPYGLRTSHWLWRMDPK